MRARNSSTCLKTFCHDAIIAAFGVLCNAKAFRRNCGSYRFGNQFQKHLKVYAIRCPGLLLFSNHNRVGCTSEKISQTLIMWSREYALLTIAIGQYNQVKQRALLNIWLVHSGIFVTLIIKAQSFRILIRNILVSDNRPM